MELSQHSLNRFLSKTTQGGSVVDPSIFSNAVYLIYTKEGIEMLRLSLGDGITAINSEDLEILIQPEQIDFAGTYMHQLVAFDQDGKPLPPTFKEEVTIEKVQEDVNA